MSETNSDQSATEGVRQNADAEADTETNAGGSTEPDEDPETPGATAAVHHPPAE